MRALTATAPAKVILFGEHAVVYGYPAIAIPVFGIRAYAQVSFDDSIATPIICAKDLNIRFKLGDKKPHDAVAHIIKAIRFIQEYDRVSLPDNGWKLDLWSHIPIGRGLGSSAAISIALIKVIYMLLGDEPDQATLLVLSYESEKYHHGTPSGIDNTVIALEKPIFFQKKSIKIIDPQEFHFVIGDTGIAKKTAQVVAEVAEKYQAHPSRYKDIFQSIGDLSDPGLEALENGDRQKLGKLMDDNQFLLDELDVSCDQLNRLIETARTHGALGAKLCGAGKGGCMLALAADSDMAESIEESLLEAGAVNCYITVL